MKASVLYKWLTYSAIVISVLLCLFMLQAGLKGNFRSVDAFQAYIRVFGLFAPFVFVFIQAFQVVVPVLPGFIGCVADFFVNNARLLRAIDYFLRDVGR